MRLHVFVLVLFAASVVFSNGDAFGQFVWTKDARNPILSGVVGTWNKHVLNPCVLFNPDSTRYEMWFNSSPGPQGYPNIHPWSIGFATSKDGISWAIYPSAVLSKDPAGWDKYTAVIPEVIRENGQYKMWYFSYVDATSPNYMGYATSPDGVHWTKYASNPVFGPGIGAWESGGPLGCSIMRVQGEYKMWYIGYNAAFTVSQVGYATSVDGITWNRDTVNNPILTVGGAGQWDGKSLFSSNVFRVGSLYYMAYVGANISGTIEGTGMATSLDGITNWKKYDANPVLVGSPGAWDQDWADVGTVLLRGDTLDMWYEGYISPETAHQIKIGHATSPFVDVAVDDPNLATPTSFALEQNYPNPFNPSTTIRYGLPLRSHVTLTVFNTLGQQIAVLQNGKQEAGYHQVHFDGDGLSSGVFFYRLRTEDFVETKRFLLLK
jgi:predicted GH43/DUF377 family glycosyl hydrolase